MPQLDPTWFSSQLFWLALTFVGLYIVLSRMVLPPLMDVMARRQQTIAGDIGAAQRMKDEAEHARATYEKTLNEARAKAQNLLAEATAKHKTEAESRMRELDRQIERKLADASRRIADQKAQMLDELVPTSAELAAMIVEKIAQHAPHSDHVAEVLEELNKSRRG